MATIETEPTDDELMESLGFSADEKARISLRADTRANEIVANDARYRTFGEWLRRAKTYRSMHNVASVRKDVPPPFVLDEYERRRAIEEDVL